MYKTEAGKPEYSRLLHTKQTLGNLNTVDYCTQNRPWETWIQ